MKPLSLCVLTGCLIFASGCVSAQKREAMEREKDPQYQYEKAALCMQYNMVDEALKYMDLALALNPRHAETLNLRGLAWMLKGNLAEAIRSLEASVAASPSFSEAWNNLATALQENGEKDRAGEAFRKAFEIDGNYNASYNLAKLDYEGERHEAALAWVRRSIAQFPKSVLAFNLQGLILEALERFDEAIASYQQASKIAPDEVAVQFNLAMALYRKKDYDRSREILTKILPLAKTEELRLRIEEMLKRIGRD